MIPNGGRSGPEKGPEKGTEKRVPRRAVLKAGLAGALLASCSGGRRLPGSLVGGSHQHAHRLRDGAFPPAVREVSAEVAILGGGMAGLSAAWKLRRSGLEDFLLFELETEPGGNSRWGVNEASAYPWGAHYVPVPPPKSAALEELFRELGVITGTDAAGRPVYEEQYLCHAPQERLFIHGRWQEGLFPSLGAEREDFAQLRKFREQMERYRTWRDSGGKRAFAIPLVHSSEDGRFTALDRISMKEYLDREGFTSPRLRWYVEYGLRDDYACRLETTSAWAGIHYHAAREEEQEVLTWPEGNGWIARRLAEPLGDRLRAGALVIEAWEEEGQGRALVLDTRSGEVTRVRAKRLVLALPRFVAARVLRAYRSGPLDWLGRFTYAPWLVANLTVRQVPTGRGAPPSWDNVIYGSESLGYVTATHQELRRRYGPSVLTYYRPFTGPDPSAERRAMADRSFEEWVELILGDLGRAHPDLRELTLRCDVLLLGHAMVRPLPGLIWSGARREAVRALGPIHFAHSDLSGLSIFEEAHYHGLRAAEEALKGLGVRFESSLGG